MAKLTINEQLIESANADILKEVYAKLLALRMEYLVHNRSHFNPEYFENFYNEAIGAVEKRKMTKIRLCIGILNQTEELMKIGFTKQHLLKLVDLDIK